MYTDFCHLITLWKSRNFHFFHGKITKNFTFIIYQMSMWLIIRFKKIFPIYSWDFAKQIICKHLFNVTINSRTTNLRMRFFNFIKNFFRRKMTTVTGFFDNFSILMYSHTYIMIIFYKKASFL